MSVINNPDKIAPGGACFGICLTAFQPGNRVALIPRTRGIVPGKAVSDYANRPVTGEGEAMYFLPDILLDGTDAISEFYSLANWKIFNSRKKAIAARAAIAREAITYHQTQIRDLGQYI